MLRKRPGVHLDGVGLGSGRQGRGVGAQAAPEKISDGTRKEIRVKPGKRDGGSAQGHHP